MMKRITILLLLLVAAPAFGQSLNILTALHPRPHTSFIRTGGRMFTLSSTTQIVTSDNPSVGTQKAVQYFQRVINAQLGTTLPVVTQSQYNHQGNAILIADTNESLSHTWQTKVQIPGEVFRPESYILDINPLTTENDIVIIGADSSGTFYGVSTLLQLLKETRDTLPSLHIFDWPDYPIRWVFSQHNMMVLSQVADVEAIEDSMAAHKLNGLQQNDFKYSILDWFDNYYYSHVDTMHAHAGIDNVEVIPGVCSIGYSQGELIHDPDVAEGIPTICTYQIDSDTGRLIGDPQVALPHGDFENATGGKFPGWGYYDPTIFVDSTVVHNGRYSARCENFSSSAPNGRFIKMLTCKPHSGYHMSAWFRTQNFSGEFNLLAIGFHGNSSSALTFTQFPVNSTSTAWQQANVIFNTLNYDSMYVYCGVWSGSGGTIWLDDFSIEDAGMTNLLRRRSDMPRVTSNSGSTVYKEGVDYAVLIDSTMEKANGSYTWHASPTFRALAGGTIHNGDQVQVHFIRANPVLNDLSGDGSTMVCVSEDTLYSIIHDQVHRVDSLLTPKRYMMGHDEIRVMNWDSACSARHSSPADLLADNLKKCDSVVNVVHSGAERFVWSDMFDSLHNAHNNYYLVNGDLTGDWNKIPTSITIVNWNGGNMDSSLAFFERHGFSQVTSPYYDVQNTANIRAWRDAMERHPQGMRGMMYTTWAADYSFLMPFADYAWSAGPMIVHEPIDSAFLRVHQDTISADVFPDPYDPTDSITTVTVFATNGWDVLSLDTLHRTTANHFVGRSHIRPVRYRLTAIDHQGITHQTPLYSTGLPVDVVTFANSPNTVSCYPNPARESISIQGLNGGFANITIRDLLGRSILHFKNIGENTPIDLSALPSGAYNCFIQEGEKTSIVKFIKE